MVIGMRAAALILGARVAAPRANKITSAQRIDRLHTCFSRSRTISYPGGAAFTNNYKYYTADD